MRTPSRSKSKALAWIWVMHSKQYLIVAGRASDARGVIAAWRRSCLFVRFVGSVTGPSAWFGMTSLQIVFGAFSQDLERATASFQRWRRAAAWDAGIFGSKRRAFAEVS